ncbi:uncharacterized protein LOC144476584 [Augochlora pura]
MTRFRFLILSTLIFTVPYCFADQEPNKNAPISLSKNNDGPATLKFSYIIEDSKTKIPCMLANMSITIVVNYTMNNNEIATKNVTIPSNAVGKGSCDPVMSTLSLVWGTKVNEEVRQNVVKFLLFNDRTKFSVFSADVDLFLDPINFPNAADERRITKSEIGPSLFHTPIEAGQYKFSKEKRIMVGNDTALIITDVSLIAFNTMENSTQRDDDIWHDIPGIGYPPDPSEANFRYIVRSPITQIACILANMEISVIFRYKTKTNEEKQTTFAIPTNVNVSGHCNFINSVMTLSWMPQVAVVDSTGLKQTQNSISLTFGADLFGQNFRVIMISMDFYLDEENFPGASDSMQRRFTMEIDNLHLFDSNNRRVYTCDYESVVEFNNVKLTFNHVDIIAFNTFRDVSLLSVEKCGPPSSAYILLAVCCVIGTFSIVFIIAFAFYMTRRYLAHRY